METNVYVVSSCWYRVGSTFIGAAMDRTGAEQIADRHDENDSRVATWEPWEADSVTKDPLTWRREALLADGTVHPSLYQEIVCMPLAVPVDKSVTVLNTPLAMASWSMVGLTPDPPFTLSPPMPPSEEARDVIAMTIKALADNRAIGFRPQPEDVRVGNGPAEAFIRRAADRILAAGNPPDQPWKVDGGLMAGLRIVVDPNIPPNMIRIGEVAYLIDVPTEGSMVRIGGEVIRWLTDPPPVKLITNPPSTDRPDQ